MNKKKRVKRILAKHSHLKRRLTMTGEARADGKPDRSAGQHFDHYQIDATRMDIALAELDGSGAARPNCSEGYLLIDPLTRVILGYKVGPGLPAGPPEPVVLLPE